MDRKRILVIDDDEHVRLSIARVLELDEYEVETADRCGGGKQDEIELLQPPVD